jgi:hypothetical protein
VVDPPFSYAGGYISTYFSRKNEALNYYAYFDNDKAEVAFKSLYREMVRIKKFGFDEEGFEELDTEGEGDAVGAFERAVLGLLVLVTAFEEAVAEDVGGGGGVEAGVGRVAGGAVVHVGAVARVGGRGGNGWGSGRH